MNSEPSAEQDLPISSNTLNLIEELLSENGITDFKITASPGSTKGDNYLGDITKITVNGTDETGNSVEVNYVVKTAPTAPGLRSLTPIKSAYEREINMYEVVLPAFMQLQEKRNVESPFKSFPKCLKTSLKDLDEAVIMEDMKSQGYVVKDRKIPLNYDHAKLVFENLAKLHAFSFAIKDQDPELYKELASTMRKALFDDIHSEKSMKHIAAIYGRARQVLDPDEDADALSRFDRFATVLGSEEVKLIDSPEAAGGYDVIRHADCKTTNFLFAYEDETHETPTKFCFLDWQTSCVGSPVLDLLYFIYSCTGKQLWDEHFDELFQFYHDQLKEFTAELGSDIDNLFPYAVFMQHLKQFGMYGLVVSVMMVTIMTSDAEETPDMNEDFEDGRDFFEVFTFKTKNEDSYKERMRDVILHQVEKEYI